MVSRCKGRRREKLTKTLAVESEMTGRIFIPFARIFAVGSRHAGGGDGRGARRGGRYGVGYHPSFRCARVAPGLTLASPARSG